MVEGFKKGFYTTSFQAKKEEMKLETQISKHHTSSSKAKPSSQTIQEQLQITPPRQPQKHQHATISTEDLPKKQKISNFQAQIRTFNPYMDLGDLNKEQILGMTKEEMAKLILALIGKNKDLEKQIEELAQEQQEHLEDEETHAPRNLNQAAMNIRIDEFDRQLEQLYESNENIHIKLEKLETSVKQQAMQSIPMEIEQENNKPIEQTKEKYFRKKCYICRRTDHLWRRCWKRKEIQQKIWNGLTQFYPTRNGEFIRRKQAI